jgi:hypothetical protein
MSKLKIILLVVFSVMLIVPATSQQSSQSNTGKISPQRSTLVGTIQIKRAKEKDLGTLLPGQLAYAYDTGQLWIGTFNGNRVLFNGIPGAQGLQGIQGVQGQRGLPGIPGQQGIPGKDGKDGSNATITIGTVTTTAPGTNATVTNVGTATNAILNITIPRGFDGINGLNGTNGINGVGIKGEKGEKGDTGLQGPAGDSKLTQVIRATTAIDGTYTWVFPTPFPAGVIPVISVDPEAPGGAIRPYQAHIKGVPTNTSVTVQVFRIKLITPLGLGTGLEVFEAPGATAAHIIARQP